MNPAVNNETGVEVVNSTRLLPSLAQLSFATTNLLPTTTTPNLPSTSPTSSLARVLNDSAILTTPSSFLEEKIPEISSLDITNSAISESLVNTMKNTSSSAESLLSLPKTVNWNNASSVQPLEFGNVTRAMTITEAYHEELDARSWRSYYHDASSVVAKESANPSLGQVAVDGLQTLWEQVTGHERVSPTESPNANNSTISSENPFTSSLSRQSTAVDFHKSSSSSWLVDSLSKASQNLTVGLSAVGEEAENFLLYEQQDEPLSLASVNNLMMNDSIPLENSSWPNMTFDPFGNETGLGLEAPYNYWALLLLIFPIFTVFGNVLVILSVKRERTLHNVTNYFIVSLAVADLLVAALVMPFGVYLLLLNCSWELPPIFCDFYIAMDVTCSTSSICNLVAISIDRFIAVTQPIKYAKHKSNTRVWLTIVFVWVFSGLVGSPIVLGLNTLPVNVTGDFECAFNNKYFVLFSSLCSFYIPCAILVCLYYRIFKVIRERAKKAVAGSGGGGGRKPAGNVKGGTVIENLAQTKRLAETTLGGPSSLPTPKSNNVDDEKLTNTGSGSQEDGDDLEREDMDVEVDGEDASPDSDDCHIIPNSQAASAFVLECVKDEEKNAVNRGNVEPNGNHDSGYAASNMGDALAPGQEPSPASPKLSLVPPDQCKRNGLSAVPKEGEPAPLLSPGEPSTGSNKKPASRFTICKVHKASRKKREKSSAKRERKATKTLAIVLGLFLICWLPFFTCNIMDAICTIFREDCSPSLAIFLITTWLGYVNSCLNPVIYTIFNPEFRKAFKKIMGMAT